MTPTFRRHFDEDIARAESLLGLANGGSPVMRSGSRADDLRLGVVAMAVGAMDAYFCDAYADCLARRLQAYKTRGLKLPTSYSQRNLPTEVLLSPPQADRPNWSLRMAARAVMEKENVLNLESVKGLFNPVLPSGQKLWESAVEPMIDRDWIRFTGIGRSDYYALLIGDQRRKARKAAVGAIKTRVKTTIQLRHDWIHNCGRPKTSVRTLTSAQAAARVREIRALVETVDDHLMVHRIV